MKKRLVKKDGFTLIEIIFVILILGILAGALAPMAYRLVEQTRVDQTKEEMEKIKTALLEYYADNNTLPPEYVDFDIIISGATYLIRNEIGLAELAIDRTSPTPTSPYWNGPYISVENVIDIENDAWGRLQEFPWDWGSIFSYTSTRISMPASYIYDRDPKINDEVGGTYGDIKAIIHSRGPNREPNCWDRTRTPPPYISMNTLPPLSQAADYITGNIIDWDLSRSCGDDIVVTVSVDAIDDEKEAATQEDLFNLRTALIGNPDYTDNGKRNSFGFVGDIGQLPITLTDLAILPTGCDAAYGGVGNGGCACGGTANELCNWNGPYLDPASILFNTTSSPVDRWRNGFIYTTKVGADPLNRRNRIENNTDDGFDTDNPLRSMGRNQQDDGGETIDANCVRFCDDVTLSRMEGPDGDTIIEPFFTTAEVLPATNFSVYVSVGIYNGTGIPWPNGVTDNVAISLFFDYRQGDGRLRSAVLGTDGDPPTGGNPITSWIFPAGTIAVGNNYLMSAVVPSFTVDNPLPIGYATITAKATVTTSFPGGGPGLPTEKIIRQEIQILPNRNTISVPLKFSTIY